jgi:hypothetical protein
MTQYTEESGIRNGIVISDPIPDIIVVFITARGSVASCIYEKGKVVPVLNELSHEDVWGSGYIDPHFLDLGTSWR